MKFLLLVYGDEREWETLPESQRRAAVEAYGEVAGRFREQSRLLRGAQLDATERATTVRVVGGETVVTDGPYAETKEALGGYFLVEVDSIEEAVELAKQLPAPGTGGGVEVRPVYEDNGGGRS